VIGRTAFENPKVAIYGLFDDHHDTIPTSTWLPLALQWPSIFIGDDSSENRSSSMEYLRDTALPHQQRTMIKTTNETPPRRETLMQLSGGHHFLER
jgi:hypothetical protein